MKIQSPIGDATLPGGSGAQIVSDQKRKAEQARFVTWQNSMRPEDTGHREGVSGKPLTTDAVSQYECVVRDNLNSRLGVVRNQFAEEDAKLATEMAALQPKYQRYQELVVEKRSADNRAIVIRMERRVGMLSCAIATILSATLMGVLWIDKGLSPMVGVLVALFSAVIASLVAYPCGIALRQGAQTWHKWLAVGILALVGATLIGVATNMRTPSFDVVERIAIGVLIFLAASSVAMFAFMMHDQDAMYPDIERWHSEAGDRLSALGIARAENRVYHTNNGRRHVEIARQIISSYRESNRASRSIDNPPPSFFDAIPELVQIEDDWLSYLEVKQK